MEELLLRAGLGLEELDVVDEQDVDAAVGGLEAIDVLAVERAEEVVRERLGGGVADGRAAAVGGHVVADRVQEVRLAEAGRAADEERVVGEAGHLGDRERRGVGEAVGVADDELLEGVAGVEAPRRVGGVRRGDRRRLAMTADVPAAPPGPSPRPSSWPAVTTSTAVPLPRTAPAQRSSRSPKRCWTQGRIRSGATTTRVPSSRRWPVSGSSHWCQVDSGTARCSSARIRRQQDGCSSSVTGRRTSSSRGGTVQKGVRRGPDRARSGEHSTGSAACSGPLANRAEKVRGVVAGPTPEGSYRPSCQTRRQRRVRRPPMTLPGASALAGRARPRRAATVRPAGGSSRAAPPRTRCPRSGSADPSTGCARAVHSVWMDRAAAGCVRPPWRSRRRSRGRSSRGRRRRERSAILSGPARIRRADPYGS